MKLYEKGVPKELWESAMEKVQPVADWRETGDIGLTPDSPDTPGEVVAASRSIPYSLLRQHRLARVRRTAPLRQRERARTRAGETGGVRHGLIILAQFPDLEFQYGRDQFETLINGTNAGSALSYFKDQWKDAYTFRFDITEAVNLPQEYA